MGKLLFVNLSKGEIRDESFDEKQCRVRSPKAHSDGVIGDPAFQRTNMG